MSGPTFVEKTFTRVSIMLQLEKMSEADPSRPVLQYLLSLVEADLDHDQIVIEGHCPHCGQKIEKGGEP